MRRHFLKLGLVAVCGIAFVVTGISLIRAANNGSSKSLKAGSVSRELDRRIRGQRLASSNELVMVFIGSAHCAASRDPSLPGVIRSAGESLAKIARKEGIPLVVIGAALDWSPFDGLAYLQSVGAFDEVISGRNWANSAALEYLWVDHPGPPSLPQVVLLRRELLVDASGISVSDERLIARKIGLPEITTWQRALASEDLIRGSSHS